MKLNNKILIVFASALALTGCDKLFSNHVKCDDESATSLVTQVLNDNLEKSFERELKLLIKEVRLKI